METINAKIKELLSHNKDIVGHDNFIEKFDAKMEKQEKLMDELDVLAKAKNTILGRTMRFPMADSYALYVITRITNSKVTVKWLNWCDAWVDDRLGYEGTLPLDYATKTIVGKDKLDALFSKPKA